MTTLKQDIQKEIKELKPAIDWIKLQCKDEIIAGIDMNNIDNILKQSLERIANKTTNTSDVSKNSYRICVGREGGESNCGKMFINEDDNVCLHCGSKNTQTMWEFNQAVQKAKSRKK